VTIKNADEKSPAKGALPPAPMIPADSLTALTVVADPKPGQSQPIAGEIVLKDGNKAQVPAFGGLQPTPAQLQTLKDGDQRKATGDFIRSIGAANRIDNEIKKLRDRDSADADRAQVALYQNRALVARTHHEGSLEAMRKRAGFDQVRERLWEKLHGRVDFTKGFQAMQAAIWEQHKVRVNTMAELNQVLPDVTTHDILLVSTLARVPKAMLIRSIVSSENPAGELTQAALPMVYDISLNGIQGSRKCGAVLRNDRCADGY
jgi:hypothetical protein